MISLPIYFSFDFGWIEIAFMATAWFMLVLGLWPLSVLKRPRRRQLKLDSEIVSPPEGWPGISVVVYCRDEASSLERLLEKLFAQEYEGKYEIIVANDGQNAGIGDVVNRLNSRFGDMRVTFVPDGARSLSRRKMAFTLGIKAAKYDIVLLTCADTIVGSPKWIASVASQFVPEKDIVIGPAVPKRLYGRGLPRMMRRLDIELITLTWISSALHGKAFRGEGHNLAFRKQVFFDHKGYARTLNLHYGDDDLFVNEISNKKNTAVNIRPEGLVKIDWRSPKHMLRDVSARRLYTSHGLGRGARSLTSLLVWATWLNFLAVVSAVAYSYSNGYVLCIAVSAFLANWTIVSAGLSRAGKFLRLRMPMVWLVPSLMLRPLLTFKRRIRMMRIRSTNFTWHKLPK
ncbi:MAG: glycosyltransferase [Muribaculaceae bacterium]|nr:glycosyltransferase [Muribaculaceae bacterium]